jgi:hypothetical protein
MGSVLVGGMSRNAGSVRVMQPPRHLRACEDILLSKHR